VPAVVAFAADREKKDRPTVDVRIVLTGRGAGPLALVGVVPQVEDDGRYDSFHAAGGTTDHDGVHVARGLPEGRFRLIVLRGERRSTHGPFETDDGPVELELDVGGVIRGRLVANDEGGVPGVHVTASAAGDRPSWGEARTGTDGEFVITDLARDRAHALTTSPLPGAPNGDFRPRYAEPLTARPDGKDVLWRVPVGRGIGGVVVDVDGEPVRSSRVWFVPTAQDVPGGPVLDRFAGPSCTTDHRGRFRMVPLADGRYRIGVDFEQRLGAVETRGGDDVTPGTNDLRLVVDTAGEISGRLTGPDGAPVSATIRAHPSEPSRPYRQSASSEQDGRWTATGLDVRYAYDLVFFRPGYLPAYRPGVRVGARDVDVRLERGESVEGRVVHPNGDPVAGICVVATATEPDHPYGVPAQECDTDDAGRFTITGLPEGEIKIEVGLSDSRTRTTILGHAFVKAGARDAQIIVTVQTY